MGWSFTENGHMKQRLYPGALVRQMGNDFWVISRRHFAGMIMLETKNRGKIA